MNIKEMNNIIYNIGRGNPYEDEKYKISIVNKKLKIYRVENLIKPNKRVVWVSEKYIVNYLKKL